MKKTHTFRIIALFLISGVMMISGVVLRMTLASADNGDSPGFTPAGNCAARPGSFDGFTDVHAHIRYCSPIDWMYWNGAVSGYSDDTFRPNNVVTRGQFSKMIVLAFALGTYSPPTPTFADVPTNNPFYSYIEKANQLNLVSGRWGRPPNGAVCIGNGVLEDPTQLYFTPCLNITRAQMSKPLSQAAGFTEAIPPDREATFSDVDVGSAFYTFIERLAMHIAYEEWPPNTPPYPSCSSSNGKPCYFPTLDGRRNDAATLIYLAKIYESRRTNLAGRSFARSLREVGSPSVNGFNGVRAYARTPFSNAIPNGRWVAMPIVIAGQPRHFIESGPQTLCTAISRNCQSHPYGSWATGDGSNYSWNTTYSVTEGTSFRYQSYYGGYFNNKHEWWSEYYDPPSSSWVRMSNSAETGYDMGTDSLVFVEGAVETSGLSVNSETLRVTLAEYHLPGTPTNQWSGWCPGVGLFQRKMFTSYIGPCSASGSDPFSWDTFYHN